MSIGADGGDEGGLLPVAARDALASLLVGFLQEGDGALAAALQATGVSPGWAGDAAVSAAGGIPRSAAAQLRARRALESAGLLRGGVDVQPPWERAALDTLARYGRAAGAAATGRGLPVALGQWLVLARLGLDFEGHEVLEPCWLAAGGDERRWLQGLIQLSASGVHRGRDNRRGAVALARAAAEKLAGGPRDWHGVPVAAMARYAGELADALSGESPGPAPEFPG